MFMTIRMSKDKPATIDKVFGREITHEELAIPKDKRKRIFGKNGSN